MIERIGCYPVLGRGFCYFPGLGKFEGTGGCNCRLNELRRFANGQLKQRLSCFARQMLGQVQKIVFVGVLHLLNPVRWNPVTQKVLFRDVIEKKWLGRQSLIRCCITGHGDFLNCLVYFNQLGCAGLGMGFQFAPHGPFVGVVVVVYVAQHQAIPDPMHDDSDVAADADGPETRVRGIMQLVESQSG